MSTLAIAIAALLRATNIAGQYYKCGRQGYIFEAYVFESQLFPCIGSLVLRTTVCSMILELPAMKESRVNVLR